MKNLKYGLSELSSMSFCGIEVYSHPHMPEFEQKIILKLDLSISENVRNKINSNLLTLFGEHRVYYQMNNAIYAHPNNITLLEEANLKNV